ncbi:GNAT family N-acetyltransferase [Pantoea sp. Cy-639]|uniref:GNAT family N-acetyltransferase n=1 Tax=Pantoea sp. Cy-639 TaxID=2608360 RepID=UPI0014213F25|nr:GNAT family N-acetyltransferase [Pantoea sp. Cy-639]NIF18157.1 GNAT family N-acetyltransferase [Pantoea sp. Cy-639]
MDIEVRTIREADLPQLLRLCRRHAEYEAATWVENNQVERWSEALFCTSPDLFGWVAQANGHLCGFMTATVDYATWDAAYFAHMDCLYIEDEYRGHGIGRRFFDCLDAFCRERKIGHAQWQTPPDNQLGIGFYQRMGATSKPKLRFFHTVVSREGA